MLDLRPALAPFTAAFARTATVTPVGGAAVEASVIWDQEAATPAESNLGASPSSAVNRRVVAWVRRDEVPSLPLNSTIQGGPEHQQKTWRVMSLDQSDPDYHIAVVV